MKLRIKLTSYGELLQVRAVILISLGVLFLITLPAWIVVLYIFVTTLSISYYLLKELENLDKFLFKFR